MKIHDYVGQYVLMPENHLSMLDRMFVEPSSSEISSVKINGDTATISVTGVLINDKYDYPNVVASMPRILNDVNDVEKNDSVKNVIYYIDSPGGSASMMDILGNQVRKSKKNTVTFVAGMAASGAYWFASQTDKIIVTPLSDVGSIGAMTYRQIQDDVVSFVSSNAKFKCADGSDDESRASIIKHLDSIEKEFINAVAVGRGVTPEHVIENFGNGGMFLGREAVAVGMADELIEDYDELMTRFTKMGKDSTGSVRVEHEQPTPIDGVDYSSVSITELESKITELEAKISEFEKKTKEADEEVSRVMSICSIDAPGAEGYVMAGLKDSSMTKEQVMEKIIKEMKTPGVVEPYSFGGSSGDKNVGDSDEPHIKVWNSSEKVRSEFVSEEVFKSYYEHNKGEF